MPPARDAAAVERLLTRVPSPGCRRRRSAATANRRVEALEADLAKHKLALHMRKAHDTVSETFAESAASDVMRAEAVIEAGVARLKPLLGTGPACGNKSKTT